MGWSRPTVGPPQQSADPVDNHVLGGRVRLRHGKPYGIQPRRPGKIT